ncbi:FAD:protein FMN transferase [Sinimarinibacterium sp. NLF-5-8]|uniref:FAD:protein FMN transferase n=1 Tax=Sinimarinibacterium sp. NLF-5-8 TaxID=2698684 RepID=UPI00137BED05|nr:FAD:protein FMN transferase [Sinimarinibacterium sp. NLF-5-8]QHS10807.1 FAD:protein FMN transferase [Sinimarinibacterium sp. NLF-5-8]
MHVHHFHGLGGPCALHLDEADAALRARAIAIAEAEVQRIEHKYSRYRADSVLSHINAQAGRGRAVTVDAETTALLNYAATAYTQSGGLFDITSGVLRRAWDFKTARVPTQAQIDALLPLVGWSKLRWQSPHLHLPLAGMELDFGGFGKEYAVDRVAGLLLAAGVRHALVDFAGDLRVLGARADQTAWPIGIQHPRQSGAIATLPMTHGALATSGDYERGFVHEGQRYSHLLNPQTGWPVQGLMSVSVRADQCLVAGTATTCALLMGARGKRWLAALGLPHLWVDAAGAPGGSIAAAAT